MTYLNITIANTPSAHKAWRYLTQSPSDISAPIGDTVMNFLTKHLGFEEEYVDTQIMTVFIDGKPVDDICSATVPDKARIGLGAIAPGVAGMTMCRNSPIAALRGDITFEEGMKEKEITQGTVTLLLFNAVMEDKGLSVLEKGMTIPAFRLEPILDEMPESVVTATKDDEAVTAAELKEWAQKNPQLKIQLRVESA